MKTLKQKAIVAGGGVGGLASALFLQSSGWHVTILEKNESAGGKLNSEEIQGFVFDTGPSILTLPTILEALFTHSGVNIRDYLTLVPLDPQWRCWFNDQSHFDFRSGREAMAQEVSAKFPKDVDGFGKLLDRASEMYKISEDNFFFRNVTGVLDLIKAGNMGGMEGLKLLSKIEPQSSFSTLIEKHIRSPHLRQALEHLPQYVGSSPFLSPAILGCLVHVQFEKGCWYPMGGMGKISEALIKRFKELGGEIILNTEVKSVETESGQVVSITSADERRFTADSYVVNVDINSFQRNIRGEKPLKQQLACSGVTVFLGLSRTVKNLSHHNFFFSESHKDEFKDLYTSGVPHQDPTIYVCVPSKTDPAVAPMGKENVFLLIHVPTINSKINWDQYLPEYVSLVEKKLARMGFDVSDYHVEVRKARSPADIGTKWGTYQGNIYGLASHGKLAGGFKHGNKSKKFSNLYFAGGTVNPGAGVPMSIMSGMIAAAEITGESRQNQELRL
jgi:diapolycopene oxygenase